MSRRRQLSGVEKFGWPGAMRETVSLCEERGVGRIGRQRAAPWRRHASKRELRRPTPRANAGTAWDANNNAGRKRRDSCFQPAVFTAWLTAKTPRDLHDELVTRAA